jgi:hypothetical protein
MLIHGPLKHQELQTVSKINLADLAIFQLLFKLLSELQP